MRKAYLTPEENDISALNMEEGLHITTHSLILLWEALCLLKESMNAEAW